eukprot:UN09765
MDFDDPNEKRNRSTNQSRINQSRKVTQGYEKMTQRVLQENERLAQASNLLSESATRMNRINKRHKDYAESASLGKKLLSNLSRRMTTDNIYYALAFSLYR